VGAASRLKEEADAYRERIVAQAEGDAQRFKTILPEYQKAPQVMRDRMYTDTMQQIYGNVTKVLVDSKQGSNMLYLPLDKIMQQVSAVPVPAADVPAAATPAINGAVDTRSRDLQRSRDRDPR
jgi:membrane protease subunit HflK